LVGNNPDLKKEREWKRNYPEDEEMLAPHLLGSYNRSEIAKVAL